MSYEERKFNGSYLGIHTEKKDEVKTLDELLDGMIERWKQIDPEIQSEILEKCGFDVIEKAKSTDDYKQLVQMTLMVNMLAKEYYQTGTSHNIKVNGVSDFFYSLKEIFLAKASMYALRDAEKGSWGWREDENETRILYFDIPGYSQYSFHMPNMGDAFDKTCVDRNMCFSDLEYVFATLQIPKYQGDWIERHSRVGGMSLELSKKILNSSPRALSFEDLKNMLQSEQSLEPSFRHRLYCEAMAHPDFRQHQQEIQLLLFFNTPTLPGALSDAYVAFGEHVLPEEGKHTTIQRANNQNLELYLGEKIYDQLHYDSSIIFLYIEELNIFSEIYSDESEREQLAQRVHAEIQTVLQRIWNTAIEENFFTRHVQYNEFLENRFKEMDTLLTFAGIDAVDFYWPQILSYRNQMYQQSSSKYQSFVEQKYVIPKKSRKKRGRETIRKVISN